MVCRADIAVANPPGWSPRLAAQIGATIWPVGLLLSVEVLCRVPWPQAWPWILAWITGTAIVAISSAIISYDRLREVLLAWRYGMHVAIVGPLALDRAKILIMDSHLALRGRGLGEANYPPSG